MGTISGLGNARQRRFGSGTDEAFFGIDESRWHDESLGTERQRLEGFDLSSASARSQCAPGVQCEI